MTCTIYSSCTYRVALVVILHVVPSQGLSFLRGAGRSQGAARVADTGYYSNSSSGANDGVCSVSGGGSAGDEGAEEGSGACASYEDPGKEATSATDFHGGERRWLFSMELNLQVKARVHSAQVRYRFFAVPFFFGVVPRLYFQHSHFVPLVGVGKERCVLICPW